jgi:O-antigen/teichoic acid export membrane protein
MDASVSSMTDVPPPMAEQPVRRRLIPLTRVQLKATAIYTFFGVLPLISQTLLLPINTRFLSPGEFGITTLANVCRSYVLVTLMLGLDAALERMYFDRFRSPAAVRALLGTVFSCLLAMIAVVVIVSGFFGPALFERFFGAALPFATYGWLTIGAAAVQAFVMVLLMYYRVAEDVGPYTRIAWWSFLLPTAGALIGIAVLRLGAFGSIAGRCLGQIVIVVPVVVAVARRAGLAWERPAVGEMLRYGAPVMLCTLLSQSNLVLDKILAAGTFGLHSMGVYSAANLIAYASVYAVGSLWGAISPDIFRLLSDRPDDLQLRLERYAETLVLLYVVCLGALYALIGPVLHVLAPPTYQHAAYYIPLLGCAYLWRPFYLLASSSIYFHRRTRLLPLIYGAPLAGMALFFFTVGRQLGMAGICLTVGVGEFGQFAAAYVAAAGCREHYFRAAALRRVVIIVIAVVVASALGYADRYVGVWSEAWLRPLAALLMMTAVAAVYRRQVVVLWDHVLRAHVARLRGLLG